MSTQAARSLPPFGVDRLLLEARDTLVRITPQKAAVEAAEGAFLIDIRSDSHLAADGPLPGAVHIGRNVLEWRLDPASPHALPGLRRGDRVIVICDEGYQSSLAAATVRRFGVDATDVIGGLQAWRRGVQPPNSRASIESSS